MFGRKKKTPVEVVEHEEQVQVLPTLNDEDDIWNQPGPRSLSEVDTSTGYVDMGSVRIPAIQGMQLRTQVADDQKTVLRVLVVLGASGIQMSVAAAPRSGGVWDEVREQLKASLEDSGGTIEHVQTRYGQELLADMPVKTPDGRDATSRMRIIGREGDRWFARIDIIGPAAQSLEAGEQIEKVIDRIVVVRDDQPRARLDLLPLHVPSGAVEVPNV
ncbi:DUF3710 domain-containing protein [Schaalia vaccimaxillae]|uniref:DUF3710 domain-containing protein n=1 Tax=Schaalia vaccimaxillae TaxID=183916 RepID=UPI0003B613A5|nr:DUF3710 domain-containing protein [Schaalia vaccimaxillae]